VALVEVAEDEIRKRLDGRDDEGASARRDLGPDLAVEEHVLDAGREVEGQLGMPRVELANEAQGMARTVQEVGIAGTTKKRPA
jgi:hypothetical protein